MNDPYFPNQPAAILEQEYQFREIAGSMPEESRLRLYSILSACVPSLSATEFRIEDDVVIACQGAQEIAFPRPLPLVKLAIIAFGYEEWLQRKYSLPGFVTVEHGDLIVDCGAYVGGFSLAAAPLAREVHAFEPDEANLRCARRNLATFGNTTVSDCGLYNRSADMTLNLSASSVEHSLLQPDDGAVTGTRRIRVVSLADYARDNRIDRYDFVKIEAEGVELEVFAGLGEMRPRKLAIDVSPERNGESPADEFRSRLGPLGYQVRQRGQVMFARLD